MTMQIKNATIVLNETLELSNEEMDFFNSIFQGCTFLCGDGLKEGPMIRVGPSDQDGSYELGVSKTK